MRIVLDTNILISACLQPAGNEARVLQAVFGGRHTAFVSQPLLSEYRDVTSRPKFAKSPEKFACLQATFAQLAAVAKRVHPDFTLTLAADEDDNRVLECAVAASARYIITGNLKDFPKQYEGGEVINALRFLLLTGG